MHFMVGSNFLNPVLRNTVYLENAALVSLWAIMVFY